VYVADYINNRIRKVTVSTGIITTIAGTGTSSYSGDNGPATSASFNLPRGVAVDEKGTAIYVDFFSSYLLLILARQRVYCGFL